MTLPEHTLCCVSNSRIPNERQTGRDSEGGCHGITEVLSQPTFVSQDWEIPQVRWLLLPRYEPTASLGKHAPCKANTWTLIKLVPMNAERMSKCLSTVEQKQVCIPVYRTDVVEPPASNVTARGGIGTGHDPA